ncbi:protein O-glucosyltransferase 1 [Canna indica]|uniref:Protein O-glucosyltransferase 1 n=1 Tax=Canna indica TaxID=4628 RepID=A0AAQ3QN38_9LILI|nr:protein O-glucosyltransferase 1 [Canna indica]
MLGTSVQSLLQIDCESVTPSHTEILFGLDIPFSISEVANVIKTSKNYKSPGPDGLVLEFYKKFWDSIGSILTRILNDLLSQPGDLARINSAFITLIPKKEGVNHTNDFRPISLENSVVKIFSKLLANRLIPHMPALIENSQGVFTQGRNTIDCYMTVAETTWACNYSKRDSCIIKFDFARAFDSVGWDFVEDMLIAHGFPPRWISWISHLLRSTSSSIITNGTIGVPFLYKRGLRQVHKELMREARKRSRGNELRIQIGWFSEHKMSSNGWLCCKWRQFGKEGSTYAPLESRTKVALTTRLVAVFFLAVVLLALISTRWIDIESSFTMITWSNQTSTSESHHPQPIALTCSNTSTPFRCQIRMQSPSPSRSSHSLPSPSCPEYFRWIHEDLRPWKSTGITREAVEEAQKSAAFRLLVIDGKLYVEKYHRVFQTRDLFTLWGFVQLANRYPGRLPDLDLMFNCEDMPVVKASYYATAADSPPLPPLFRYCKDDTTVDIVFPDWSFWGWPEIDIKPWEKLSEEMKEANERMEWKKRKPFAHWRGNPSVSWHRLDLMNCNPFNGHDWNARIFAQDWKKEIMNGFNESNLAEQCDYRYKIFVEGRAWSVSEKYTLACDSPALFVTTHFYDFMTRGLMPGRHYWPIREYTKCLSIKLAVDWGNKHQNEVQAIGKQGSRFIMEEVKMEYVYQYMLHLLTEYAKLLRYKPTLPEKATELCLESLACGKQGRVKDFLLESMVTRATDAEPCTLPPPYTRGELEELRLRKVDAVKQVEKWEKEAWDKGIIY